MWTAKEKKNAYSSVIQKVRKTFPFRNVDIYIDYMM